MAYCDKPVRAEADWQCTAPHQRQNEMASTKGLIEAFAPVLVAFHPSRALVNHDSTLMVFAAP